MRRQTPARAVAKWNAKHPVGAEVIVRLDSGEKRRTRTRSQAQVLSGHTAVIWVEGISGCYLLDRVAAFAWSNEAAADKEA